ncbi:hypothetical protein [Rhizorhabdus dicambivorans]|uniref:Uncharacterized protein n=1 Tax=Rhizorhabdus dicambivorans TaxID=1850238 RepID=A0A2A4FU45_9SPHN|nr:hypothetical protein [Rhizorhabdus dicambivorans]ATE65378.1 hypothetical protein CMV14_14000 [Rhizorhabdus dicambivorans]PCE42292.1 hypothetical protein COO09_09780 [Rhizorhabdus dicambivorans]
MRCDTRLLDRLRQAALLRAQFAREPGLRRRYAELAQRHADSANHLRIPGSAAHWPSIAAWTCWQPAYLAVTNDR